MGKINITELSFENEQALHSSEFLYTTHFWVEHLCKEINGCPVLLDIKLDNNEVFFVGVIFKKYGIRICGSPFEGWSTPYMGFIGLKELSSEDKVEVLSTTVQYLKKCKKCKYVQICDWHIDYDVAKKAHFHYEHHTTYLVDIRRSEEELFASFKTDVRTNCRNFEKRGGIFSIVEPSEEFAKNYYNQLVEVFDKQKLKPFYSCEKILNLIKEFGDHKDLILCENVSEPENGKSIATGIFFGYKSRFYFFGAASLTDYQLLRPNEYVLWSAIKYWKSKGCISFDMLGIRKYKEKFRPEFVSIPVIYSSSIPFLHLFKRIAKTLISISRRK